MKYAKSDLTVSWSAGKTTLKKGEPWNPEADLVRERPDLFEDEPVRVAGGAIKPRVERATRAPGETRRTPNPRKSE